MSADATTANLIDESKTLEGIRTIAYRLVPKPEDKEGDVSKELDQIRSLRWLLVRVVDYVASLQEQAQTADGILLNKLNDVPADILGQLQAAQAQAQNAQVTTQIQGDQGQAPQQVVQAVPTMTPPPGQSVQIQMTAKDQRDLEECGVDMAQIEAAAAEMRAAKAITQATGTPVTG